MQSRRKRKKERQSAKKEREREKLEMMMKRWDNTKIDAKRSREESGARQRVPSKALGLVGGSGSEERSRERKTLEGEVQKKMAQFTATRRLFPGETNCCSPMARYRVQCICKLIATHTARPTNPAVHGHKPLPVSFGTAVLHLRICSSISCFFLPYLKICPTLFVFLKITHHSHTPASINDPKRGSKK